MGPPSAASGEICLIAGHRDAPKKRPSVNHAMVLPNTSSDEIVSVV